MSQQLTYVNRSCSKRPFSGWMGLLWLSLGWLGWPIAAVPQVPPAKPMASFQEFYALSREQALAGRPLRLQGTVLCYDADWGQCFIHDGHSTVYFNPRSFSTQPRQGDAVELTATTCWTGEAAVLTNLALTVQKQRPLPPTKPLPLTQLANEYGQWIQTSGRVRMVEASRGRLALVLHDQGQSCLCYVMGRPRTNDFTWLLGAQLQLKAINISKTVNGRLEEASLMVPSMEEVMVVAPPRVPPRQLPVRSIDSLLSQELGPWTNDLVHLQGVVSAYQPREFLELKDPTGVLRARTIQATPVKLGQRVNVWGFLGVSPTETVLREACFELVQPPRPEAAAAPPAAALTTAPKVLTRVADIMRLSREQAAQNRPVRLRGVITCADPEWHNGFLQDQTGAIYLDLTQPEVRAGQWVEVTAQTSPGSFAHQLVNVRVSVLGTTNLPAPAQVDLQDLANGLLDAHWIQMQGVVRRISRDWNHITLNLTTAKGRFHATLPWPNEQPLPTHLIDALVSIQGAAALALNARHQVSGVTLRVPSLEQIGILQAVPADPFSVETLAVTNVATFKPDRLAGRRVKLAGTVTLVLPDQSCFLQDASGGIQILAPAARGLQPGDTIEALGFPVLGEFAPGLEEAVVRKTGRGPSPLPTPATAEQILLDGAHDATLVQLEARLLQKVVDSARPKLVLQSGTVIFSAYLQAHHSATNHFASLAPGSELRLRGICVIQGADNHEPAAFRLLLAQPADVQLLRAAPWWTARHIGLLAAGLTLLVLMSLAWIGLLRRQVQAQTRLIRQQLRDREQAEVALRLSEERFRSVWEHSIDGMRLTDGEGRILAVNEAYCRLVRRPREELVGQLFSVAYKGHGPNDGIEVYHQRFQTGNIIPRLTARVALWNGEVTDLEIANSFVELGTQGKLLFGLFRDISARKQAELRLAAFSNLGQRLSAAKTAKEAGQIIVEVADRLLGWDACSCDLYSAKEDRLHHVLNMDLIEGRRTECPPVGDTEPPPPLTRRAIQEGALLLLLDPAQPGLHPNQRFGNTSRPSASLLFVPIRNGSEIIGVLSIQSYTPQAYNQQSLETLQALADHCGAALERIKTEEALRRAQERLDFLVNQSPAVLYSLQTDGHTVTPLWVSKNLKRLLGYEPAEVLQPDWWSAALHPADRESVAFCAQRRLTEGQLASEYRVRHKQGDYHWLRDEQRLVRDAAGQPVEIVGTWTDITERKQAEAALAYERDLLTTLLDNLPDLIYFKDLQSRYVRISKSKLESTFALALSRCRAAGQLDDTEVLPWHLSSQERFAEFVVGRTDLDFYDEPRARASFEDEQAILRTGQPLLGRLEEMPRPDGKACWLLTTKMPWRDKDGKLIGTFGISNDITFIKEAEAKLEAAHKQLVETSRQAGMAEVATSVLHNVGNVLNSVNVSASLLAEKLRHSKAGNLAKVVALLGEHAADLGHFLTHDPKGRQLPLYLGQLAERLGREQAFLLTELGSLTKNIDHIKHVVAMQQSFARVAGVAETLPPTDLLEDALRINANTLARHAIQIVREYDPQLPLLTVEKHKVLQILVNLIRNAQHACQETARPDKCLTLRVTNGANRVHLSVSDNGVGIAPENLTRIFNFGFTTRKDGHGFGLHSGALAARDLGGTLLVSSAGLGQGATFTLELPLAPSNDSNPDPATPAFAHADQDSQV